MKRLDAVKRLGWWLLLLVFWLTMAALAALVWVYLGRGYD